MVSPTSARFKSNFSIGIWIATKSNAVQATLSSAEAALTSAAKSASSATKSSGRSSRCIFGGSEESGELVD